MEFLQQAVITKGGDVRCPVCGKKAGELAGNEVVKNLKMMCRGGRRGFKHYFVLNVGETEEIK